MSYKNIFAGQRGEERIKQLTELILEYEKENKEGTTDEGNTYAGKDNKVGNYNNLIIHFEKSAEAIKANWKSGAKYAFSHDFCDKRALELVEEFTNTAKNKGLTIRQAQQVFLVCADYVLENELN